MTAFRRILVPHDFSNHATSALKVAAKLVAPGGRLVVLHVIVPFTPITDVPPAGISSYVSPDELVDGAERQLAQLVRRAAVRRGVRVEARVEIGDPYQRII